LLHQRDGFPALALHYAVTRTHIAKPI
jgi:hypothetical protein